MYIIELLKIALTQLRTNRMRSVLTTLGIVIGIGTVILIVSVLEGYRSSIEHELNVLGTNTFQIQKYHDGIQTGQEKRKPRKDLTIEMANAIRKLCPSVKYVGAENWEFGEMVIYKGESTNPNIFLAGATPEFIMNNQYFIQEGRFLTDRDVHSHAHVIVLGMDIVDKLFPYKNPIGEIVRVHGQKFRVIGIFESRGNTTFGESRDNRAVIPITTWQDIFGKHYSVNITIMAKSAELFDQAMSEVIGVLRKIRKVPPGEENDFDIFYNQSLIDSFNNVARYIQLGGIIIGIVSLIVGGIGVMNIMLVSVTERTREIGIRKAVGARRINILGQFLFESITLCILGGILGFGGGIGLAGLIYVTIHLPISIPLWSIIASLLSTTAIGIISGLYPAYRAAWLNVVDALRYE